MAFLTETERLWLEKCFPNLKAFFYEVTSSQSESYNCVAWAMSDETKKWWPDVPDHYWPRATRGASPLDEFARMLGSRGYERCADGALEAGFEKAVVYAIDKRLPTHMARQLPDGSWTGKLGAFVDIRHASESLTGSLYGEIFAFYRKAIDYSK